MVNDSTSTHSDKATKFYDLLSLDSPSAPKDDSTIRLSQLRRLILLEGLPDGQEGSDLRPPIWRLLLHLHHVPSPSDPADLTPLVHPLLDSDNYHNLVSREPSPMFTKIRNDTFRTLATDQEFLEKVGEDKLVRCLEAFVWRQIDQAQQPHIPHPIDSSVPYVQGCNVLAAPFLYVLPSQMEAWACFTSFIENQAPRYIRPTLVGVHDGLQLVDQCLLSLDPTLYAHLSRFNLSAELYAFPSILTFCAATPPLKEVLELWDFLLSFGCGLNVLCVVAQLWIIRSELLESKTPMKLLRTFPPLKSKEIIPLVVQFLGDLSPELYDQVVRHPWDDEWKSEASSS
ncbi:Bub2p [Sporobolomyces salmoneus]|uniref:Bub2p n=1 Tax=Sporobolomyces salmoneus TaxID=183962 RepID=UPI00317C0D6C